MPRREDLRTPRAENSGSIMGQRIRDGHGGVGGHLKKEPFGRSSSLISAQEVKKFWTWRKSAWAFCATSTKSRREAVGGARRDAVVSLKDKGTGEKRRMVKHSGIVERTPRETTEKNTKSPNSKRSLDRGRDHDLAQPCGKTRNGQRIRLTISPGGKKHSIRV